MNIAELQLLNNLCINVLFHLPSYEYQPKVPELLLNLLQCISAYCRCPYGSFVGSMLEIKVSTHHPPLQC